MNAGACVRGVTGIDADDLDDAELDGLIADLKRRQRERMRLDAGVDAAEAINLEAKTLADDLALAAKVEKRNAALNIVKRKEAMAFVDSFGGDAARGLEALLAGTNKRSIAGGRLSVDARVRERTGRYLGGMIADLKRDGLLQFVQARLFASGKGPLDDKIALELYELRDGGSPGKTGSAEAAKIAKIVHKYQELARADQNRSGAFIRKMPGYIVSQSHDMWRIRAAGKDEWIKSILPLLDGDRTFDGAEPVRFLGAVYDELSTGQFYSADPDAPLVGFKGPANLAKKVSQSRVLHFKGGEEWVKYNDAFGMGSLMEGVFHGLQRAARNTALMETLGPNPRAMFDRLLKEYREAATGDAKRVDALNTTRLERMMSIADGTADIPGNINGAMIMQGWRTWQNMSSLGGAVLSSIPDIATAASDLQFQGRSFLGGMRDQVAGFFASARSSGERRQIAERLGAGIDGMIGNVLSRMTAADTLPGRMNKFQNAFFRLNLLSWWTDAHESAFSTIMAHDLARASGSAFEALGERQRMVLGLYNIGAREWDVIRAHAIERMPDGRDYALPDVLRNAPDEVIAPLVDGKVTPQKVAAMRDSLESRLRAYYLDRTSYGVLKGGIRERFSVTGGYQPGTSAGEALRLFMQFKSYSVSFVSKVFGRYGEADRFWQVPGALASMPKGEAAALAGLIVTMTALGYVSMSLKDVARGMEPRDPTDAKTWGAAFLQGGGAGIYGDFIFANYNRFDTGPLATVGGPTAGDVESVFRIWGKVRDYAAGRIDDAPDSEIFQFVKGNTPFLNLFYARSALDYLILYQMQEAISPGSLARLERRVKEDTGREFLLPPSAAVQ